MKRDMTTGVAWKQMLLFSLPIIAGNLLQQLYGTVDGIVVGNFVSPDALSAVGTCTGLTMVFLALAIGLSTGNSIMISQYFGSKRYADLRRSVSTSMISLITIGAVLSVVGFFSARALLRGLLGVPEGPILDMASEYFAVYSLGLIFQFAYNVCASTLRAIGDSRASLYFLCVATVVNIVLDILLVTVVEWGVFGVAIATVASQAACSIVSVIYMFRKYELLRFSRSEFVFDAEKFRLSLRLGIPTALQQCIVSFSNVGFQRVVNHFGPNAMAAFAAGGRIDHYVSAVILGFNTGLSNFVGQNIGAGNIERIKPARRQLLVMSCSVTAVLAAIVYIFAPQLSLLFGVDAEALELSVGHVRRLIFLFVIFAAYGSYNYVLQGSGDAAYASTCTLLSLAIRVTFTYVCVYAFDFGFYTIAFSPIPAWTVGLVMSTTRYYRGKWQAKGIVKKQTGETAG